jgi:hypothetical protein
MNPDDLIAELEIVIGKLSAVAEELDDAESPRYVVLDQIARLQSIRTSLPFVIGSERSAAVHSVLDEALNSGDGTYRP